MEKSTGTPHRNFSETTGFQSPAQDYIEKRLDLNERYIHHPAATFFMRVDSDAMTGVGIFSRDILIVDRSLEPKHRKIVVAAVGGELIVRRLHDDDGDLSLIPENPEYETIEIKNCGHSSIWGVVTVFIHELG